MKIKTKVFTDFLDKIKVNGNVNELIFDFNSDGLKINAVDVTQTVMVNAILSKNNFSNYKEIGKIGIQNLQELITILKGFGDEIDFNTEGNLLSIKQKGKKVETELINLEFIKEVPESPSLDFNELAEISATEINKFISDVQINKTFVVDIETKEKEIMFKNTGKYKFEYNFNADTLKGGFKGRYGNPLKDAFKNLVGKVTLSMNTEKEEGYPIKIFEKTDNSIISIIVAPLIVE